MHARAIGIENSRHFDAQPMLAVVIEEQRLGAAFAFIVTGARSDGIDIAPIVLGLRMDVGIAIDLAGRGLKNLRLHPLGETEHIDRAMDGGFRGLHRIALIVNWRSRARQVVDLVDLDIERKRHVVPHQFEAFMTQEMLDVVASAGIKIVYAKNLVVARKQRLTKKGADETGAARDQNSLMQMHLRPALQGPAPTSRS